MSEAQAAAVQPALIHALLRPPPREQHRLLEWSRGLAAIRYGELRGGEKTPAMLALTRETKAQWPLAKVAVLALKHMVWDACSWKLSQGLGAIIVTFIAIGNAAAATVDLRAAFGSPCGCQSGPLAP